MAVTPTERVEPPVNTQHPDESETTRDLGPYRLLGLVQHEGGLAVCAAVHRQRGTHRLLKLLLPERTPGAAARRFVRQARAMAALGHPVLPATFESGRLPSGAAYLVTEWIEGEPADAWVRRTGSLGSRPAVAAAMVAAVAGACAHLARMGIVHGDLRPGNVRLIPDPIHATRFTVKLMGSDESALRPGADARADIHALGCLFFELLKGTPPSPKGPDLGALVPGISPELQRSIARMLAGRPERRYQSMDEIVTAIELTLQRHRSRFAELLSAPQGCLATPAPRRPLSPDLAVLAPALTGDTNDCWIAGTLGLARRAGSSLRDAVIRRLVALRRPTAMAPTAAPTILVAEDDEDTRQALVELLQDHGYQVVAARHGREAQEYLRKGQPAECMLMDLWMPEMDGWTLAAEMKEGRLPPVPTIVITAAEPRWGYPCPIVVRKPFDSRQLLGLVRAMSATDRTRETPPA